MDRRNGGDPLAPPRPPKLLSRGSTTCAVSPPPRPCAPQPLLHPRTLCATSAPSMMSMSHPISANVNAAAVTAATTTTTTTAAVQQPPQRTTAAIRSVGPGCVPLLLQPAVSVHQTPPPPTLPPPTTAPLAPLIGGTTSTTFARRRPPPPAIQLPQDTVGTRLLAVPGTAHLLATLNASLNSSFGASPNGAVATNSNAISAVAAAVVVAPPESPVTLAAPRPENERLTNEYVDTPFRGLLVAADHPAVRQTHSTAAPLSGDRTAIAVHGADNHHHHHHHNHHHHHHNHHSQQQQQQQQPQQQQQQHHLVNSARNSPKPNAGSGVGDSGGGGHPAIRPTALPLAAITKQPIATSFGKLAHVGGGGGGVGGATHNMSSNGQSGGGGQSLSTPFDILHPAAVQNGAGGMATLMATTAGTTAAAAAAAAAMAAGASSGVDSSLSSIKCPHCLRCRCEHCQRSRPLPSRWICDNTCFCSAETIIDYASCLCCVKALYYHCSKDHEMEREGDSISCADNPCSCVPHKRAARWGCMAALSCCLPCLWCYWPMRGCVAVCAKCYARQARHGCRCNVDLNGSVIGGGGSVGGGGGMPAVSLSGRHNLDAHHATLQNNGGGGGGNTTAAAGVPSVQKMSSAARNIIRSCDLTPEKRLLDSSPEY